MRINKLIALSLIILFAASMINSNMIESIHGQGRLAVTVQTDKETYQGGEPITISGYVSCADTGTKLQGAAVFVQVLRPDKSVASFPVLKTDSNGHYKNSTAFKKDADGTYTIDVTAKASGWQDGKAQTTVSVTPTEVQEETDTESSDESVVFQGDCETLGKYYDQFKEKEDKRTLDALEQALYNHYLNQLQNNGIVSNPESESERQNLPTKEEFIQFLEKDERLRPDLDTCFRIKQLLNVTDICRNQKFQNPRFSYSEFITWLEIIEVKNPGKTWNQLITKFHAHIYPADVKGFLGMVLFEDGAETSGYQTVQLFYNFVPKVIDFYGDTIDVAHSFAAFRAVLNRKYSINRWFWLRVNTNWGDFAQVATHNMWKSFTFRGWPFYSVDHSFCPPSQERGNVFGNWLVNMYEKYGDEPLSKAYASAYRPR
jgi:hypothetical protein